MKRIAVAAFLMIAVAVTANAGESDATLETTTGSIQGTLLVPDGPAKMPVALLIAGSGPTDRNGNSPMLPGANDSLKMLAQGLAANGIASLRYDKRGIAASQKAGTSEEKLRFDMYVDDAAAWMSQLRKDPRFTKVIVIGHSEGSLIGIIAAQKVKADGVVSIAGAGRPAADTIRTQLQGKLPPPMLEWSNKALDSLVAQKSVTDVPQGLEMLFRPSVQPYLMSWFRYDPAKEVAKLKVPVLLVQGTTDVQTSVVDVKLLGKGRPAGEVLLIEGMNHVLKAVDGDIMKQLPSYSDPKLPVVSRLIEAVAGFVNKV